jgi:hypothetical protein
MKVGKEEVLGMLMAVEMWVRESDHKAEWNSWVAWMNHISDRVKQVQASTAVRRAARSIEPASEFGQETIGLHPVDDRASRRARRRWWRCRRAGTGSQRDETSISQHMVQPRAGSSRAVFRS